MSSLIKHHSSSRSAAIRGLSAPGVPTPTTVTPPQRPAPTHEERHALEAEIEGLLQERDEIFERRARELDEVRRAAHAEALRELIGQEEKRLNALRENFSETLTLWRQKLEETELLALSLAHTALDRLLRDPAQHINLIKSAIERQLAELKRDSVVVIALSPVDFTADAVRDFAEQLGGALDLTLDPDLTSGAASIGLRLGRLDISLVQHRETLDLLWRRLADGKAP